MEDVLKRPATWLERPRPRRRNGSGGAKPCAPEGTDDGATSHRGRGRGGSGHQFQVPPPADRAASDPLCAGRPAGAHPGERPREYCSGRAAAQRAGDLRHQGRRQPLADDGRVGDDPRDLGRPGAGQGVAPGVRAAMDRAAPRTAAAHRRPLPVALRQVPASSARPDPVDRPRPAAGPAVAPRAALGRGVGEHGREGVPASARGAQHGGRGRAHRQEPLPDQGRGQRVTGGAADHLRGPGPRPGGPDAGAVPPVGLACGVRQPPLGRGHRSAPLRHRRRPRHGHCARCS